MSLIRTVGLPMFRRWRVGLVSAASLSILPVLISAVQALETVSVNDPRPLYAAVKVLEERCHCAITYEDPQWRPDDVDDISGSVAHKPGVRVRIPKGGLFTFDAPPGLSSGTPAQAEAAIAQVVRAFQESGSGRGAFRVAHDATTVHVIPVGGSVLDTPVTVTGAARPLVDVVTMLLAEIGQVTGKRIGLATFPINFFKQRRVAIEATQQPARAVLLRTLAASERPLSWRLFYDATMGQYYLSIHFVPQPSQANRSESGTAGL
jgi:hypothetical protein